MTLSIAVPSTEKNYQGGIARRLQAKALGGGRAMLAATLAARGEPRPASSLRLMQQSMAQTRPRYRIGDGAGRFLTRDGQGVTHCSREAWFGDELQLANALACFPVAQGMRGLRVIDGRIPHRSTLWHSWGPE